MSRAEKSIDKAIDVFLAHQEETEERSKKQEDDRWKKETELEEKRRKEDRAHEMAMMQMIAQMFQGRPRANYDYNDYPDEY